MTSGISEKERLIEAIKNSGCITYGERTGTSGQKLYYFINLEKLTDGNNTGSLYLAKESVSPPIIPVYTTGLTVFDVPAIDLFI